MDAPIVYILLKYGGSATKHQLYDQIWAKRSNYCKIDISSQWKCVSLSVMPRYIHTYT